MTVTNQPSDVPANTAPPRGGPRTETGKANSSRNATKHGLLARTVVLPTESQKRFARLLNSLRTQFQPANPVEKHLVESMAVARWRQMRAWGFENAAIGYELRNQPTSAPEISQEDDCTRAALAVRHSDGNARFLDRVNYWEARHDRQYDRALKRLLYFRNMHSPAADDKRKHDFVQTN